MDAEILFPELSAFNSVPAATAHVVTSSAAEVVSPPWNHTAPRQEATAALHSLPNRPLWALPGPTLEPVRKGTFLSVKLNDDFYSEKIANCSSSSFIGRLILPKGSSPWKFHDLREMLKKIWHTEAWSMLSIGLGYMVFQFYSKQTRDSFFCSSLWKLSTGNLYLQPWVPNFVPGKTASTRVRVWVRLYGLLYEHHHRSVIMALAAALRTPIRIDTPSLDRCFGNYVKVLVEVDLSQALESKIQLETPVGDIWIEASYEDLPVFCHSCLVVSHTTENCRRNNDKEMSKPSSPPPRANANANLARSTLVAIPPVVINAQSERLPPAGPLATSTVVVPNPPDATGFRKFLPRRNVNFPKCPATPAASPLLESNRFALLDSNVVEDENLGGESEILLLQDSVTHQQPTQPSTPIAHNPNTSSLDDSMEANL